MKFRSLILLLMIPFLPFYGETIKSIQEESSKPATIKVLLERDSNGILLEARGPFAVYNPATGKKESSGKRGKRFYLYPHSEGIKWGEDFLGIFQLQLVSTSPTTAFLVNGIQYTGAIEVYNIEGKLNIINEVSVENFIKATLSDQVPDSLPPSVIDAIAILARTNAYYTALLNYDAYWHTTAKETGYKGQALTLQNIEVDRAVDNTRYLVMAYEGQPFPTAWTDNCGGKTATYSAIFRKNTATPNGVESPYAGKSREQSHWTLSMDTQELAKVVKTNRVTGIDLFVDHDSGKVYAARLRDGNHVENIDFLTLQKRIGSDKLKSNEFTVNIKGNVAFFEGYGKGTGVGLCLYSATQMAQKGTEAPQILATFFPSTEIVKMRSYPKAIVSAHKSSFISPKQKEALKKKHRLLYK